MGVSVRVAASVCRSDEPHTVDEAESSPPRHPERRGHPFSAAACLTALDLCIMFRGEYRQQPEPADCTLPCRCWHCPSRRSIRS